MSKVKDLPSAKIVRREDLTDDLMKLWLEPPAQFSGFEPGQYCTIGMDGEERPYSIVSAPHESLIELFLELIPEKFQTPQSLTPKLWTLRVGDTVTIRPKAKGAFTLDLSVFDHIYIATVTGIAPFVSMLRAMRNGYYKLLKPFTCMHVLQGASYHDEFGYYEELKGIIDLFSNPTIPVEQNVSEIVPVCYVPTVSRPREERNASWAGRIGRINEIAEQYLHDFRIATYRSMVYLCGNEGMIDDLGNAKGTPEKPLGKLVKSGYRIKKEVFF